MKYFKEEHNPHNTVAEDAKSSDRINLFLLRQSEFFLNSAYVT